MSRLSGEEILNIVRGELEEVNKNILEHEFIALAEEAKLPIRSIKKFVVNQLYIVPYDMRSLAFLLSRSRDEAEAVFFKTLVEGDYKALLLLKELAKELDITSEDKRELYDPRSVAYTHYLSWLALHASLGQAAVALTVNLPVWGSNSGRLARALKKNYGIKNTGFLEFFASPSPIEELAHPIIERYADIEEYILVAKTIQLYEKMFWDSLLD